MPYILALILCASVAAPSSPGATATSDASSDSLWAYRDRFAASATHVSVRMHGMSPVTTTEPSREYTYLEKAHDALIEASWLLTWTCDIVHMQREMCEPQRAQYKPVVTDRMRRTRDTLVALQSLLTNNAHPGDQETMIEILARNRDLNAAARALDSMLERMIGETAATGGSSH